MKKIFINSIIAAISALCFWSCSQEPYDWSQEGPTVIEEVKNSTPVIEKNSIKMETFINVTAGAKISKVIYTLLDQTQTIIEEKEGIPVEDKKGYFTVEFTELQASTTYMIQVKAYSSSSKEPVFSEGFNVTTANDDYRLITGDALDIKENSVTLVAEFSSENIKPAKEEIGIAYSINPDEVKLSSSTFVPYNSNDGNVYFVNVTNLNPGTIYYYCACMIINGKRIYAEDIRNVQLSEIQITEGELIDLGLSVKWMAYNLGGESITDFGNNYGWGDQTGRLKNEEDFPKFSNISGTGYDAAWYNLGEQYRIPTEKDWQELVDNCKWEWVVYKEKKGYRVTGPNKNSIFLPAAGYKWMDNGQFAASNIVGYYRIGTSIGGSKYHYEMRETEYDIQPTNFLRMGLSIRPVYDEKIKSIKTSNATNITGTSVTIKGTIECASGVTIEKRGIWYGTTEYPHEEIGTMKQDYSGKNDITLNINGLSLNTTYYHSTYAVIDGITYFSSTNKFTTKEELEFTSNEAVDLGLSVKWAGCNLGATSAEETGDTNHKWDELLKSISPYPDEISGTEYDPAKKQLGGEWRLPTKEEAEELVNKCTHTFTVYKGVTGYLITGSNGNTIFFPSESNNYFNYMTGTKYSLGSEKFHSFSIGYNNAGNVHMSISPMYNPALIRPVQP